MRGLDFPYSWTPDSKSVIFVSDRNGSYNIFQQRVDNPEPELLIGGHGDMISARLSPDERSILYLVTPPGGETPTRQGSAHANGSRRRGASNRAGGTRH
jgi:Tol biopolymer transport system component